MREKVSVIGNGALSVGVAAQMARGGADVTYIDAAKSEGTAQKVELGVRGVETYTANLTCVAGEYASVKDADIVVFAITGSLYDTVFREVTPHIREGQIAVFFPACFGAINFLRIMRERQLAITVCEAVSFVYVCEQLDGNIIQVQNKKSRMRIAVNPTNQAAYVIDRLNRYFEVLVPARNFLETSLDNINMTLHPLPLLLNIASAERNLSTFHHYTDGISSKVGKLMEKMDQERMMIGAAFGVNLTSAYQQLVEYYGERNLPSLTEYASSDLGPYTKIKGFGLDSRYINEDIPFLIVPAASLAEAAGVKTPIMNLCIELANHIMDKEYREIGFTLYKMGLDALTKDDLLKRV